MIKKLIPAAALLVAVGSAHAELNVYGLFDVSYGKNMTDDANNKGRTGILAVTTAAIAVVGRGIRRLASA